MAYARVAKGFNLGVSGEIRRIERGDVIADTSEGSVASYAITKGIGQEITEAAYEETVRRQSLPSTLPTTPRGKMVPGAPQNKMLPGASENKAAPNPRDEKHNGA